MISFSPLFKFIFNNKKMEKMEGRAGIKNYFQEERIKNNLGRRKKAINKKIFSQRITPNQLKNRTIIIPKNGSVPEGKEENQSKNKEEPRGSKKAAKPSRNKKKKKKNVGSVNKLTTSKVAVLT